MRSLSCMGVVLLLGVIAFSTLGVAIAEEKEMCVPMGTISLGPPESVEAKRAAVEFQHNRHFVIACNKCHHTWNVEEPITGCMTGGCHDLDTLPKKDDSDTVDRENAHRYYKNAYHGQCIGCHKAMKMEIEKSAKTLVAMDKPVPVTGPTGCIECHPKQ